MNEINILQILYKNRIRLLEVSLLIGIAAGGIFFLVPNKYNSTALISVPRPEVPITGEISLNRQ